MSAAVMDTDSLEGSRSLVVSGVPDVLPVSRMVDKLTIHFQSYRRSRGGDVEEVRYPTNMDGVAFVTFDQAGDAERAAGKRRHVMRDDEFPGVYLLTVFPFTRDVFFYVPDASADLSVFGRDQKELIRSLRSAHRSIRFRPVPEQMKAAIEGPFAAIRVLRQDLIRRASRLKPTAVTAAVKPTETFNPRVISPRESVKAKPGRESSGEALQSKARTQNDSSGRKVSRETAGSFYNDNNEQAGAKASSKPESAKQPGADASEERSRLDRISAAQIRRETDCLRESDQSLPSRLKDVTDAGERQPDTSIWVDSYTLRYIEKFDRQKLDRCLRGFEVKREGADLTRIMSTERKTSAGARKSLEDLKSLFEIWQPTLRVHQIDYDEKQKQKLLKICDDVKFLSRNVLYIPEDSCVKVVGPSVSSHLFCEWVEERFKEALRSKNQ